MVAGDALPRPVEPDIRFGTTGAPDASSGRSCEAGAQYRQCFKATEPTALFAHPTTGHVYAAWQGLDADSLGGASTSIYFSRSTTPALTAWTAPVRVNARVIGSTVYHIDPALTVDRTGFIVITYSSIEQDQVAPVADVRTSYSSDGGASFSTANRMVTPTWQPAHLSIHCTRHTFFLGEYRDGSTFGEKHFQTYPYSQSSRVTQLGLWSSRRSVW